MTTRHTFRRLGPIAAALLAAGLLAGCSPKYGAERDGKKLGEAICDLKTADSAEAAQSAADDVNEQLGDLERRYTVWTAEDRARIDENVADLVGHVADDNQALQQQDLAVVTRNLNQAKKDASEITKAAVDGISQGLDDCLTE